MTTSKFAAQLTAQIGEEFAAHHQYLAIAAHYESMTLPQLAGFFYRQAADERGQHSGDGALIQISEDQRRNDEGEAEEDTEDGVAGIAAVILAAMFFLYRCAKLFADLLDLRPMGLVDG